MQNAKKQLKNRVNENGFYINFVADHLTYTDAVKKAKSVKPENVMFDSKEEIPEGENIIVLSGLLSQNYPVGKKSRNGYKIDQRGVDYSDYKYNNIVLLQHNDELGWIGRARMIYLDNKGNSNIIMYVDLNTIADENTRYQIKEWYIKWVSTWHALLESKFEDVEDGWKLLDANEAADKYGFDEVWYAYFGMSDKLIYVVTKASMIENSVVTIWSNEKAILSHDTIGNCALKNALNSDMLKYLLSNKDNMKKDKLVELIENSTLTKKEQADAIQLVNSIEEEAPVEEKEEVVEETPVEETEPETTEEAPVEEAPVEENDTEAEVTEEVKPEEEVKEEPVEEETPAEEPEAPAEEVTEETNDVEATNEEPEAPVEEAPAEETVEEPKEEPETVEDNEKVEEEVVEEEAPAEEPKESESDEKLTNEIESLKNELSELRELVNSLVKDKDEIAEVVKELWDLSLRNSKNLSNIVSLWVSEVNAWLKKETDWFSKLRNALKNSLR